MVQYPATGDGVHGFILPGIFSPLALIQFLKAYNFRSDRHSVLNRPFANKWLNPAVGGELILLMVILYVPWLQEPFETFGLPLMDWIIILLLSLTIWPILALAKWMEHRGGFGVLR